MAWIHFILQNVPSTSYGIILPFPHNDYFPRQYHLDLSISFSFPSPTWLLRILIILYLTSEEETRWLASSGKARTFLRARNRKFQRYCWPFLDPCSTSICLYACGLSCFCSWHWSVKQWPFPQSLYILSHSTGLLRMNTMCALKMNSALLGLALSSSLCSDRTARRWCNVYLLFWFRLFLFSYPWDLKNLLKQQPGGTQVVWGREERAKERKG